VTDADPQVFLVDDDDSVRRGLLRLLKANGYRAVAFASAHEFLDSGAARASPACVLLDVRMPQFSGLDLQHELVARDSPLAIVFITGHGDVPMGVKAMKAGAINFLLKPANERELLAAVDEALSRAAREHIEREELRELQRREATLTPREREVMAWVVDGRRNKQIATELGIVEKTIKVHRARVMEKMRADSLADLVRSAQKLGFRTPR